MNSSRGVIGFISIASSLKFHTQTHAFLGDLPLQRSPFHFLREEDSSSGVWLNPPLPGKVGTFFEPHSDAPRSERSLLGYRRFLRYNGTTSGNVLAHGTLAVIQVNSTAIPAGRDPERLYLLRGDFCVYRDRINLHVPNRKDYGRPLCQSYLHMVGRRI